MHIYSNWGQASVHYIEDVLISGVSTVRGFTVLFLITTGGNGTVVTTSPDGSPLQLAITFEDIVAFVTGCPN